MQRVFWCEYTAGPSGVSSLHPHCNRTIPESTSLFSSFALLHGLRSLFIHFDFLWWSSWKGQRIGYHGSHSLFIQVHESLVSSQLFLAECHISHTVTSTDLLANDTGTNLNKVPVSKSQCWLGSIPICTHACLQRPILHRIISHLVPPSEFYYISYMIQWVYVINRTRSHRFTLF